MVVRDGELALPAILGLAATTPAEEQAAPRHSWLCAGLTIGFVERPDMYRMCRRCTEDVQKVYRRCTEGMYRRFCRRLKEKKAACALTGWLYGPQGMPRHRAQAARTLCLSGWLEQ